MVIKRLTMLQRVILLHLEEILWSGWIKFKNIAIIIDIIIIIIIIYDIISYIILSSIDDWWLMFCGHFCTHGRLNGPSDLQK